MPSMHPSRYFRSWVETIAANWSLIRITAIISTPGTIAEGAKESVVRVSRLQVKHCLTIEFVLISFRPGSADRGFQSELDAVWYDHPRVKPTSHLT